MDGDTQDMDLIELHELETNLVYFATSLRANASVLDRIKRYGILKEHEEDEELLDDTIIENMQAIETTKIYQDSLQKEVLEATSLQLVANDFALDLAKRLLSQIR